MTLENISVSVHNIIVTHMVMVTMMMCIYDPRECKCQCSQHNCNSHGDGDGGDVLGWNMYEYI